MTVLAAPAIASAPRAPAAGRTEQLLRDLKRLPAGHPDRDALRQRAIEGNLALAHRLAQRYAGRGEHNDDLAQVAALALVKAVEGYDPDRPTHFVSYAIPTILGALKRHFRDTTWGMRVPRSTQELVLELRVATSALAQVHGRTPTHAELADDLRVSLDDLLAAVHASEVYYLRSLNVSAAGTDDGADFIDLIGAIDPHFAGVDDQLILRPLIAALPARERHILTMRFHDDMTQAGIAAKTGISQMHVSRLLARSLAQLRIGILASADAANGKRIVNIDRRLASPLHGQAVDRPAETEPAPPWRASGHWPRTI
jgi:RNA polymerase sigma-B factor